MPNYKDLEVMQRKIINDNTSLVIYFDGEDNELKGKLINNFILNLDQRWLDVFHVDKENFSNGVNSLLKEAWRYIPSTGKISILDCSWDYIAQVINSEGYYKIKNELNIMEKYLKSKRILSIKVLIGRSFEAEESNQYDIYLDTDTADFDKIYESLTKGVIRVIEESTLELNRVDSDKMDIPYIHNNKVVDLDKLDNSLAITDQEYKIFLNELEHKLSSIPNKLKLNNKGLFLLFEGMDGAGKGTCIKEVVRFIDPRAYKIYPRVSLKDFAKGYPDLYYYWKIAPDYGNVSIMDRTWYNWVLDKRVHNECSIYKSISMMDDIKAMEKQMADEGIIILKFWICISNEEQLKRFEKRKNDPAVNQKSFLEDWENRKHWDDYKNYAEIMINETTKEYAPWIVVEANSLKYAKKRVLESVLEVCNGI